MPHRHEDAMVVMLLACRTYHFDDSAACILCFYQPARRKLTQDVWDITQNLVGKMKGHLYKRLMTSVMRRRENYKNRMNEIKKIRKTMAEPNHVEARTQS